MSNKEREIKALRMLFAIACLSACLCLSASEGMEYRMSLESSENGLFSFCLEGRGRAELIMGYTKIPIVKGNSLKRRYVFNVSSGEAVLKLSEGLVLSDMDYSSGEKIPLQEIEIGSGNGLQAQKDLIIKEPLKKIMNEIHYLSFRVYDLPGDRSMSLYVNNMFHSSVQGRGKGRWSDLITANIYPYLEKNHPADIVSFRTDKQGKVRIADINFSRGYILPHDGDTGYILPYNTENPNFAVFSYNDYDPDLYLSFFLYNNTGDNPVEIEFNNNRVETFYGMSEKDSWSGLIYLKIPEWMVIRGSNSILVKNIRNMEGNIKREWGIRNLYQSRPAQAGAQGSFSREYAKQSFSDRIVYPLKKISSDIALKFSLFNITGKNSVEVLLNGERIKEYRNLTGEGKWSKSMDLALNLEDAEKEPVLVFMRKGEGSDWGVDLEEVFYKSGIKPLDIVYTAEELPLKVTEIPPEEKETVDPIIQAVHDANMADLEDEPAVIPEADPEPEDEAKGSLFSFETIPQEAMVFCGGNPHYPGRFIGFTPFSQKIDIPPRTYIYVYIPGHGSGIYFHNPLMEFPLYKYYFNIDRMRMFTGTPRIYDIFISVPVDYRVVNSAPFVCDYDSDGFMDLAVGTSNGDLIILKREELYDYTRIADMLEIQGSSYAVPFFIDYDNNSRQDLVVGTEEGQLLLFGMDDDGKYRFAGYILEELLESNRLSGISPCFFDLDGDRKKDIILGTKYSGLFYSFNEGSDEEPVYKRLKKIALPFRDPVNLAPSAFFNYRDGTYSIIAGTRDGDLLIFQSPKIVDNELKFDNISLLSSQQTLDLGLDLVPRVLDYDSNGSYEILIGNRAGEVIIVKYDE